MKTVATSLKHFSTLLLALAALGLTHSFAGELVFESTAKGAGEIIVAGTSSLHDWEVVTDEIIGTLKIPAPTAGTALELKSNLPVSAQLTVPTKSLKSGKGGMDKKMYDALEVKTHKDASFELVSLEPAETPPTDAEKVEGGVYVQAKAKLTVTGETRWIQFPATIVMDKEGKSLTVTGKVDMLMTDFGIDPPTALLGTLKTGNEIKVSFKWTPTLK